MVGALDVDEQHRCVYVVRVPRFLGAYLERAVDLELQAVAAHAAGAADDPHLGTGFTVGRLRVPRRLHVKAEDGTLSDRRTDDGDGHAPSSSSTAAEVILDRRAIRSLQESGSSASMPDLPPTAVPTHYELRFHQENPGMQAFSIDAADDLGRARVEGTVAYVGALQPRLDEAFRAMHRYRAATHQTTMRKQGKRMREISTADLQREELRRAQPDAGWTVSERPAATASMVGVRHAADQIEAQYERELQQRRAQRIAKREASASTLRPDAPETEWREAAMQLLFELFEQQHWWRFSDLADVTGQPTARLKPLIAELCEYNNRGPYRGMYELKDQYKTQAQRNLMDVQFRKREAELEEAHQKRDRERELRKRERDAERRAQRRAQLVDATELGSGAPMDDARDDVAEEADAGGELDYGE